MKTKKRQREILLSYIAKENTDPTEDSIIPQCDTIREEMKSEHIRIRVTPSEKRYLMFFANKKNKSLSDVLLNGAFLTVYFNKVERISIIQIAKAVKLFNIFKSKAGIKSINELVGKEDQEEPKNLWL